MNGIIGQGTVCNPFACISTASNLDFGQVAAGTSVTRVITFSNEINSSVDVGDITVGGQFSIWPPHLNSLTIPVNDSAQLSIIFAMPSSSPNDSYSSNLLAAIQASDGEVCGWLIIPLTATLLKPLGVSNDSIYQSANFSLIPNPASGEVTVMLPQNGSSTVEIYDVLGNLIVHKQTVGNYVWSGDAPGGAAASGVYIVRVTEREVDGSFVVTSKRLIFER